MSYQSRRMNIFITSNIIIIILLANIQTIQTRQCYVCGKGSEEPFTHSKLEYPIPLSCDEFERSTDLDEFIFTCPLDYVGCITQTDGTDITRTCDLYPIDDCPTANDVEYCYCSTDLCNKKREASTNLKHETLYDDDDTSDMDDYESSGLSSIDTISNEKIEDSISISTSFSTSTSTSTTSSAISIIQKLSTTTVPQTTTVTTTEAMVINKIFTKNYHRSTSASTTITTTNESIKNATNRIIVKCSKVIFIMHILMLIFL